MNSTTYLRPHPHVTLEAAAELTGVRLATLRGWLDRGAITSERRGDMEVVQLEDVHTLASRERSRSREGLRERLRNGVPRADRPVSVEPLQKIARDRAGA
jgi:hypothetical protein